MTHASRRMRARHITNPPIRRLYIARITWIVDLICAVWATVTSDFDGNGKSATLAAISARLVVREHLTSTVDAQVLLLCSRAILSRSFLRAFSPASLAAFSDLKPLAYSLMPSGLGRLLISHCHWGGLPLLVIETEYSFKRSCPQFSAEPIHRLAFLFPAERHLMPDAGHLHVQRAFLRQRSVLS